MSLVALTVNDQENMPANLFLVSDILTSTKEGRNASLPTYQEGADKLITEKLIAENLIGTDTEGYPYGLIQKIYVLQKNIAIGLVGDVCKMNELLKEVKEHFDRKVFYEGEDYKPSVEDIINLADFRLDVPKYNKCFYILIFISDEGKFNFYSSQGWISERTKRFGEVIAGGQGTDDFIKFADEYQLYKAFGYKSNFAELVQKHITFFGQLVSKELHTLETLLKRWGGNYEMIYYADGQFRKHVGISNLVIQMFYDMTAKRWRFQPLYYFENEYIEDLLFIHSFDFEKNQIMNFCAEPIYRNLTDDEKYLKGYRTDFYNEQCCLTCLFFFDEGKTYELNYTAAKQPWDKEGNETKFEFKIESGKPPKIAIGSFHFKQIVKNGIEGAKAFFG